MLRHSVAQLQCCPTEIQQLRHLLAEVAELTGAANQGALFPGVRCTRGRQSGCAFSGRQMYTGPPMSCQDVQLVLCGRKFYKLTASFSPFCFLFIQLCPSSRTSKSPSGKSACWGRLVVVRQLGLGPDCPGSSTFTYN